MAAKFIENAIQRVQQTAGRVSTSPVTLEVTQDASLIGAAACAGFAVNSLRDGNLLEAAVEGTSAAGLATLNLLGRKRDRRLTRESGVAEGTRIGRAEGEVIGEDRGRTAERREAEELFRLRERLARLGGLTEGLVQGRNAGRVEGLRAGLTLGTALSRFPDEVFRDPRVRPGEFPRGRYEEPGFARSSDRMNPIVVPLADLRADYTSLDGQTRIEDPRELIEKIGDQFDATVRVVLILRQAKTGTLSHDQVEHLRVVKAASEMLPGLRRILCENGQEIMEEMDTVVAEYEIQYRRDHPTSEE